MKYSGDRGMIEKCSICKDIIPLMKDECTFVMPRGTHHVVFGIHYTLYVWTALES